jgi:amino acid adenylation domain-containing protein
MLRATLIRLAPDAHVLLIVTHHIACDGWSMGMLLKELAEHYTALATRRAARVPDLQIRYVDYAEWQRNRLQGTLLDKLTTYWATELADCQPILALPTDRPRPVAQTFRGAKEPLEISASLAGALKELAREEGATEFMVLLAALQVLLRRYTGQEDLIVGSPVAVYNRFQLEPMVGLWVNTVPMRLNIAGDPTFRTVLRYVRDHALAAYEHQDLPFDRIVEVARPQRDPGRNPLFQVMFIQQLQHAPSRAFQGCGFEVQPIDVDNETAKLDLTVSVAQEGDRYAGWIEYNTDLFDHETVRRFRGHYVTLLGGIAGTPDAALSELPLLTPAERTELLVARNANRHALPHECVHRLIELQAARSPGAVAVACKGRELTYRELLTRAEALARVLRAAGVGPETLVGIFLERSLDMAVSLLAVLKAGGAYLPLDPTYPAERLAYIVGDASPGVVLTQSGILERLPRTQARPVCVDLDLQPDPARPPNSAGPEPTLENLAYTIYTSGSSGRPKGVQVPHRALLNLLTSMRLEPGLGPDDTLLAVTTLSFDIAALEFFLPLTVGARVVIADEETTADGARLTEAIGRERPTVMQATPATWRLLVDAGWDGSPTMKILCGGDVLPPDLAHELLHRAASVWNMYGPTETTVWSTCGRLTDPDRVSLGRPIANTQLYVLDRDRNPVPSGVIGELYIGGAGLARGYVNQPDLTAERFVPNPFDTTATSRLYRTGDFVRWRADGSLEYVQRGDTQVKVRGFRIELGEIEAILRQHPAVHDAVAVVREYGPSDKRLIGYFIRKPECDEPTGTELREYLSTTLPSYMVPPVFVGVAGFPMTPNGKIDRKALPEPGFYGSTGTESRRPPQTVTERLLAGIWKEALRIPNLSVDDNFFDLGGHSLLSMRVISEIQKRTGIRLQFRDLVLQTLRQLAARCEQPLQA